MSFPLTSLKPYLRFISPAFNICAPMSFAKYASGDREWCLIEATTIYVSLSCI